MNKKRLGLLAILCLAIGIVSTVMIEMVIVFTGRKMPIVLFPLLVVLIWGALFVLGSKSLSKLFAVLGVVCGCLLAGAAVLGGSVEVFRNGSDYRNADVGTGIKGFFSGQKIMLIVPHQDDELNVMGGAIEEFTHYGSEVYVVYLTNGDQTPAETRYAEAIACLAKQGVPEDQVIFLGYGDQWKEEGPHIYNAEPGEIVQSRAGFFATYGSAAHPAYREGVDYTVENLLSDLEAVILEHRPDAIFCCDYDEHADHKAASLSFEKVMGRILRERSDYQPRVFKGFAYRTAWNNIFDFYEENLKSTQNEYEGFYSPQIEYYQWENRVRLPVSASRLSRSLLGSGFYELLETHHSQNAYQKAQGVINGDKVFWERYTTSLCNRAEIHATSGNAELLNDFMILENRDIADKKRLPYDGVWIPEPTDVEKKISVVLSEKADLTSIVLYDHPSPEENILQAVIAFDNGEKVTTGPLDPTGAPTVISVDQKQVAAFEVVITLTEGTSPGLTELEAFADPLDETKGFVQLMDENGDFVYDYMTDVSGTVMLQLYHYGKVPEFDAAHYRVSGNNEKCTVRWSEQGILVECPPGESVTVFLTSDEEGIWDRACISNPGTADRILLKACQLVELFDLQLEENSEKEEFLQHFVLPRFRVKLWNLYYRMTH